VGDFDGDFEGLSVVGAFEGLSLVGLIVGSTLGPVEGVAEGTFVGCSDEGDIDGRLVGSTEGLSVGSTEGLTDGESEVGEAEGL